MGQTGCGTLGRGWARDGAGALTWLLFIWTNQYWKLRAQWDRLGAAGWDGAGRAGRPASKLGLGLLSGVPPLGQPFPACQARRRQLLGAWLGATAGGKTTREDGTSRCHASSHPPAHWPARVFPPSGLRRGRWPAIRTLGFHITPRQDAPARDTGSHLGHVKAT